MKCIFKNKKISAIVSVVPKEEYRFDDEYHIYKLAPDKAKRFKKMMSLDRHRIAPPDVCSSDLCLYGLQRLLDEGTLKKEEIGALLFVSQTPDYVMPPTSNVLHGKLGLSRDVICLDINQGCTGFLVGLIQAFMLLEIAALPKVVLLNGETGSKLIDRRNRITYPLNGDAGSVAVIERCEAENPVYVDVKNDGSRYKAIMIPAGAYRMPSTPETLKLEEVEEGVVGAWNTYTWMAPPFSTSPWKMSRNKLTRFSLSPVIRAIPLSISCSISPTPSSSNRWRIR